MHPEELDAVADVFFLSGRVFHHPKVEWVGLFANDNLLPFDREDLLMIGQRGGEILQSSAVGRAARMRAASLGGDNVHARY